MPSAQSNPQSLAIFVRPGGEFGAQSLEHRCALWQMHRCAGNVRVALARDIAQSEVDRVDAKLAGDQVDVALRRPDAL